MLFPSKEHPLQVSDETLESLDMPALMMRLDGIGSKSDALDFLHAYLSSNPSELMVRSANLKAFLENDSSKKVLSKLIIDAQRLLSDAKNLFGRNSRLSYCTYGLSICSSYIDLTLRLYHFLETLNNDALIQDLQNVKSITESDSFQQVETTLTQIATFFTVLKQIDVGINVSQIGDPEALGLLGYNQGDEMQQDIFSTQDGYAGAAIGYIAYKRSGPLLQLEGYFHWLYEKRHAREISRAIRLLDQIDFDSIIRWGQQLTTLIFYLVAIDFSLKMKEKGYPLCQAFFDNHDFQLEGMIYPHYGLFPQAEVVASSTAFQKGGVVMVTGANHSGKTSYLKAAAQNLMLAQLGFFAAAHRFVSPAFQKIFALFSSGEQNHANLSRFQLEASTLKTIMESADASTFVFLNEPLTSTNPVEAMDLLLAVCRRLSHKGATLLLVTHYYDIYMPLSREKDMTLFSFITLSTMLEGKVKHLYEIKSAPPHPRSIARSLASQFEVDAEHIIKDQEKRQAVMAFVDKEDW